MADQEAREVEQRRCDADRKAEERRLRETWAKKAAMQAEKERYELEKKQQQEKMEAEMARLAQEAAEEKDAEKAKTIREQQELLSAQHAKALEAQKAEMEAAREQLCPEFSTRQTPGNHSNVLELMYTGKNEEK